MSGSYDTYYQNQEYFGQPHPELIHFFSNQQRGTILDIGCGQGRNAIPLARMGFKVMGLDLSNVGIDQMMKVADKEGLNIQGEIADIYSHSDFKGFDYVLLDSMLHFAKKDKLREVGLLKKIATDLVSGAIMVVCIQDISNKVRTLIAVLTKCGLVSNSAPISFDYVFIDQRTGHHSSTPYQLISVKK